MASSPLHVILNPRSGPGHAEASAREVTAWFAAQNVEAIVHGMQPGEDMAQATRAALAAGATTVVAAGGDGTVSAVAAILAGGDVAMGVLPMGTLNHFARDLCIPNDPAEAAAVIARGHRIAVDVGEVNGRRFVNNASLGIYPDIVRDRTRQQRRLGRGKYWAMLWATHAVLRRSPFLHLRLDIDGRASTFKAPFVFIGNNDYAMEGFAIGQRASLRDGRLSIYTTTRRTRWGLFGLAARALLGRLRQADDFVMTAARTLRIESRRQRLFVATDGEVTLMDLPLEFSVHPGALPVLVPAP